MSSAELRAIRKRNRAPVRRPALWRPPAASTHARSPALASLPAEDDPAKLPPQRWCSASRLKLFRASSIALCTARRSIITGWRRHRSGWPSRTSIFGIANHLACDGLMTIRRTIRTQVQNSRRPGCRRAAQLDFSSPAVLPLFHDRARPNGRRDAALPAAFGGWFARRGWAPRPHQLELLAKARGRALGAADRADRRRQDARRLPAEPGRPRRARGAGEARASRSSGRTRSTSRR